MLLYGNLSWLELLHEITALARDQKLTEFNETVLHNNSLLRPPATESEITAKELQLDVVLPDDYKSFLLASNGFDCFSTVGVTLSTIDKVDHLINLEPELVDIWSSILGDIVENFSNKFSNSVIIGGAKEEQHLLLVPVRKDEWECWFFSNWGAGEVVYRGFRDYMEEELRRLKEGFWRPYRVGK